MMYERFLDLADIAYEETRDKLGKNVNIPDQFIYAFSAKIIEDCIKVVEKMEKDSRNHISYMLRNHYRLAK